MKKIFALLLVSTLCISSASADDYYTTMKRKGPRFPDSPEAPRISVIDRLASILFRAPIPEKDNKKAPESEFLEYVKYKIEKETAIEKRSEVVRQEVLKIDELVREGIQNQRKQKELFDERFLLDNKYLLLAIPALAYIASLVYCNISNFILS